MQTQACFKCKHKPVLNAPWTKLPFQNRYWPMSCVLDRTVAMLQVTHSANLNFPSQHARPPCPSPSAGVHSDSCPLVKDEVQCWLCANKALFIKTAVRGPPWWSTSPSRAGYRFDSWLEAQIPRASWLKNQNKHKQQKQYWSKFNKDF